MNADNSNRGIVQAYQAASPSPPHDLVPVHPTRIYLTGFMGSGKSTVGPIVANVLGYGYADLDALIEEHAGRPVREIFGTEGEEGFRRVEAEVLRETARRDRAVIALGGGALTVEENLQFALRNGLVIYLRVPVSQLVRRLEKSRTKRPLLMGEDGNPLPRPVLRAKIRALLERRETYYLRSHLVVEVGRREVGKTVDTVVNAIRRQGR